MTLSIIIPIYNVKQYLRKCVDSVLNQDLPSDEYEIILVDDGSTDGSGELCDEIVLENDEMSRADALNEPLPLNDGKPIIRVIHQKNGGLSAARNSGIEVAQGKYVMFVDSDDYVEPNVIGGLLAQIEHDNLDVLRFKYQNVNDKYEVFQPYKRDHRLENDYSDIPTDGVSFLNSRMNTQCYAWQFILRRDLIYTLHTIYSTSENNTMFTEGIYFEDTDWTPRMLCKAKRVASTDTIVYNYLMREGSITNAVNRSKQKKVLDDKMLLIATLQQQAVDLRKSGRYNRWYRDMISDTVVSIIGMLSTTFYSEKESYLAQLKQLNIYPLVSKSMKAMLINLSPRLAVELLHIKNH